MSTTPDPITLSSTAKPANTPSKPTKRPSRPNYAHIHRHPLPLQTHPLPFYHPTNPLSLLRLAYTYLTQLLSPPPSHPSSRYIGYFTPSTGAIHITHPAHILALWENGFFGKGTLSRSEPSWLEREKARLQARRKGGMTAEEATNARRAKRRDWKLERARVEAERISRQKMVEEGRMSAEEAKRLDAEAALAEGAKPELTERRAAVESRDEDSEDKEEPEVAENQEHLQLTPEEAFFLSYGLGVLDIRTPPGEGKESTSLGSAKALLRNFAPTLDPSSPFLLNYVVYHHFRSLGWVVRPGIKFGVDYLLYYRGPVFSHAEFAVLIIPSYSAANEREPVKNERRNEGEPASSKPEARSKDWWWLHCVNRVQSQVLKSLVLVYVDVPTKREGEDFGEDVGELLGRYKVREFVVRRWIANRMRD